MVKVSLILPVYKQSRQVNELKQIYTELVAQKPMITEVLVIANNNDTETFEAFKLIESSLFKIFLIQDGGWGAAIQFGARQALNDWVMYTNSARGHLSDLQNFISKSIFDSNIINRSVRANRGVLRRLISNIYALEYFFLTGRYQKDLNGTPKLFNKKVFQAVQINDKGVFFDTELMYKTAKNKYQFHEIGIFKQVRIEGKSTTNFSMAVKFCFKLPFLIVTWRND